MASIKQQQKLGEDRNDMYTSGFKTGGRGWEKGSRVL